MKLNDNEKHWTEVCKIGQGASCCKYLISGSNGIECVKDTPQMKKIIDDNWEKNHHVAQGDNCRGYEVEKTATTNSFDKRYDEPFEDDGAYAD